LKADFDWILVEKRFVKTLEGGYDNRSHPNQTWAARLARQHPDPRRSIEDLYGWLTKLACLCRMLKPQSDKLDETLQHYADMLTSYEPDRVRRALAFWPLVNRYWPAFAELREAIEREPVETPPADFTDWRLSQIGKVNYGDWGETPVPLTLAEYHRQRLKRIRNKRELAGTITADELAMLDRYERQWPKDQRLEVDLRERGLLSEHREVPCWVQRAKDALQRRQLPSRQESQDDDDVPW
jgi:hypothetical protein